MLFLYHLSLLIISCSALGSGLFRMRLSSVEGAMIKFCYTEWPTAAPLRSDKKCFFNQYNFTVHANGYRVVSRPFDNAINDFVAFTAIVINNHGLTIGQVNKRIAIDGLGITSSFTIGDDVEITVGVECAKNLYGPKCMRHCNPKVGEHVQNYICSSLGEKVCNKGWSGVDCDTPVCASGCSSNSSCIAPDVCSCSDHYCRNGGSCINNLRCHCPICFSGPDCSIVDKLCLPEHVQVSHTAAIIFESVTSRRFIIEMGSFILIILIGFLLVLFLLNRRVSRLMSNPRTQNVINNRKNISRVSDSKDLNKVFIIGTKNFESLDSFQYNSHYTAEPTDYSVPSCHSGSISPDMSIYDEIDSTASNSLPPEKISNCKLSNLSFDYLV